MRKLPDVVEVRPPFTLGDLAINFPERRVTVGNHHVSLSATEYKLLYELATHAGLVLTHQQILQRVWGPEYGGETELVRSFIRNLRRKLGDDARNPRYIFTEPQVGYRMPRASVSLCFLSLVPTLFTVAAKPAKCLLPIREAGHRIWTSMA